MSNQDGLDASFLARMFVTEDGRHVLTPEAGSIEDLCVQLIAHGYNPIEDFAVYVDTLARNGVDTRLPFPDWCRREIAEIARVAEMRRHE